MAKRLLLPRSFITGLDGRPLPGALLETYITGTSTPKAVYTDAGLSVAHANPVVADSAGRFPAIFLASGDYKTILKDADGSVIWTDDPVEGDTVTADASAGVFTSINGGPLAGLRNVITNPDFSIDQRVNGTLTASSGYIVDTWGFDSNGGSRSISRQAASDADRAAIGRDSLTHFVRYAATGASGAGNYERFFHRIEGARTLAGKQATLSFWAKRQAGTGDVSADLSQSFGTGGSPSTSVAGIGAAKYTLTSAWQRFSRTIDITSIIGKTFGTAGDDYLQLIIWASAGSNFNGQTGTLGAQTVTIDLADVQLEIGTVATPLEVRPLPVELAMCERRYEKSYNLTVAPATATFVGAVAGGTQGGTTNGVVQVQYRVRKRAVPTVTTYNPNNGTSGQMCDGALTASAASVSASGESGFTAVNTDALATNTTANLHYTAVAEL